MPELPDVELYVSKLRELVVGQKLSGIKLISMFVLRTVDPSIGDLNGHVVSDVIRLGKRIVFAFEPTSELYLVIHLMIAGRFQWKPPGSGPVGRITLALINFENGTLVFTEASKRKRAALHVLKGTGALSSHDPGGIEPLTATLAEFQNALRKENRTLKRGLCNPRQFSGIGNAYSDEILWAARLSPFLLTLTLKDEESKRLYEATQSVLTSWRDKLIGEFKSKFPGAGDVTAFRPDFAVHGKFGQSCPTCGHKVQRIIYAENESNYCAYCQNEGRMFADRSLSRLLKDDWPKTIEEMES